jgi:hypothetical protein
VCQANEALQSTGTPPLRYDVWQSGLNEAGGPVNGLNTRN